MRFDIDGEVAKNHEGRSIATWYVRPEDGKTYHLFQQPVLPGDTEGPHEMTLRLKGAPLGRGTIRFGLPGANFWASRGSAWVRQEEASNPKTIGSAAWIPGDSRVGDVDFNGDIFVMDRATMKTMFVNVVPYTRTGLDGGTRLFQGLLSWTEGGQVKIFDTRNGQPVVVVKQVGPGASGALAFRDTQDRVWVLYQTDVEFGLVHLVSDATQGYRFGVVKDNDNGIFDPEVFFGPGLSCTVGWSRDKLQIFDQFLGIPELGKGMISLQATTPALPIALAPPPTAFMGGFKVLDDTPGNLAIHPDNGTRAIICMMEELDEINLNHLAGLWVDNWSGEQGSLVDIGLKARIAECRAKAEELKVPLVVFRDDRVYNKAEIQQWCGATPFVRALQMFYRCRGHESETLSQFDTEISDEVRKLAGPWLAVVRATTGSGKIPTAEVIEAMNLVQPLLQTARNIGAALFAINRGDGVSGNPAIGPAATVWLNTPTTVEAKNARKWAKSFYPDAPVPPVIPPVEVPVVTADQIASVLAGAYFDRICLHLGLAIGNGTQAAARPKVFAWILSKVKVIDDGYWMVFKRRCLGTPGDLEAFGSRVEWLLSTKSTDAQLVTMLQDAYDRGDR